MGTSTSEGLTYIDSANISMHDFKWTVFTRTKLTVPTINISNKVATIMDTNPGAVSYTNIDGGGAYYELAFYKTGTSNIAYLRQTAEKTYSIDDRGMADGEYDVTVRAMADGNLASSPD